MSLKPILVADRVVGGNEDLALKITAGPKAVGTSGGAAAALTSVRAVADATSDHIGHDVALKDVVVESVAKDGGFWIRGAEGTRVFVLPSDRDAHKLTAGQRVSIDGVVLEMPRAMAARVTSAGDRPMIYVYATTVTM